MVKNCRFTISLHIDKLDGWQVLGKMMKEGVLRSMPLGLSEFHQLGAFSQGSQWLKWLPTTFIEILQPRPESDEKIQKRIYNSLSSNKNFKNN